MLNFYFQIILLTHVINNVKYISPDNVKNIPLMLTKACIDPHSLVKVMPIYKVDMIMKFGIFMETCRVIMHGRMSRLFILGPKGYVIMPMLLCNVI